MGLSEVKQVLKELYTKARGYLDRVLEASPRNWERIQPWGLLGLLLGLLLVLFSRRLAGRLARRQEQLEGLELSLKFLGLLCAAAGALFAMRLI